jgi:hypothetical protein
MVRSVFVSMLEISVKQGHVFTFVFIFCIFSQKDAKSETSTLIYSNLQHRGKCALSHFDYSVTFAKNTRIAIFFTEKHFFFSVHIY